MRQSVAIESTPLQDLGFFGPEGKPIEGLVPVRGGAAVISRLSIDERVAVNDALTFDKIDYIFFRRFSDGRSSQVAAYVVDNSSDEPLSKKRLAVLHKQVWMHGTVPLLYVAWPSRVDIFACARGADFWPKDANDPQYKPAREFGGDLLGIPASISKELSRFSPHRLADGTFWEDPLNKDLANHAIAAHQSLIDAVVKADQALDGENKPIMRRLLLLMVLVKYLEDRDVFASEKKFFGKYHKGAKSFREVLEGREPDEVYELLEFLENRFNGDVFKLPREGRQKLTKRALRNFAELVDKSTRDGQIYLWEQYSFKHLPVEIISHLYQRFVQGGHGKVYTPPFLAALLLDHAMPYGDLTGKERVLDPSCGSGVFLVGAFRRLIIVWRSKNNWKKPTATKLKNILKKSIFGVEKDPMAVDLTAFSLSLAICDALKPKVIWNKLKFDKLRDSNLCEADFFSKVLESQDGKKTTLDDGFDIVIGNPPFESKLTDNGVEVEKFSNMQDKDRGKLPDNQVAYLFLEQALAVLRTDGRACMIQPSGILYNRKAKTFRNTIFRKHQVETIFDFTSIRKLYEADPKTIAIFAYAHEPADNHIIDHWTFRRTASVKERICFEIDHYDFHCVPQDLAESDPYIWRTNLLGGGRLYEMSRRIRRIRSLAEYIEQNDWDYGEGFIVGKSKKENEETRKQAKWLKGKPFLPTKAMTLMGIDKTQIGVVKDEFFESPRYEDLYATPLVLIKETETLPVSFWKDGQLTYLDKIVGIHAPQSEASMLRRLYEVIQSHHNFFRFCCTLNGSQSLVGKSTAILKQDIDLIPYPENFIDLSLSFWEQVLCDDVLDYMTKYVRLGQNSDLLKESAYENNLKAYSDLFVRMLGSVYENLAASEPIFLDGLVCQPFYFGESPDLSCVSEDSVDDLRELIYDEKRYTSLCTIRVLRYYSENVLLLVKPDRLRYWIRSTAIRDADETLVDLREQGY